MGNHKQQIGLMLPYRIGLRPGDSGRKATVGQNRTGTRSKRKRCGRNLGRAEDRTRKSRIGHTVGDSRRASSLKLNWRGTTSPAPPSPPLMRLVLHEPLSPRAILWATPTQSEACELSRARDISSLRAPRYAVFREQCEGPISSQNRLPSGLPSPQELLSLRRLVCQDQGWASFHWGWRARLV